MSKILPNSEKRIEYLRRIINNRPVAILAAGPSIKELEDRIGELAQADICYFGINTFFVQENHILKKINRRFSVLFEGGDDRDILPILDNINSFLDRSDDNMLVSSLTNMDRFLDKYDKRLLSPHGTIITDRTVPDNDRPLHFMDGNGLSWLIYLAIIGKASKIVIFGADGYPKKDDKAMYYRPEEYQQGTFDVLINNTNKGFNPIVPIALRNVYKTYHTEPIPILNCSEVSFYTPFPKVSYDDGFALLLGKKNVKEISDLRVPTASIIIPHFNNEQELEYTLKNIREQSYTNYETIIVRRGPNFLDTMKSALSLAKGKYIFYCPAGNGYSNHDWINSCLEKLENRPQISLVCDSTQDQLTNPPWLKKMFIYYWLKKKNYFPPDTLCVRKGVLEKCLFPAGETKKESTDPVRGLARALGASPVDLGEATSNEMISWLNFNLRFNINGYLPVFIPIKAGYHQRMSNEDAESLNTYRHRIDKYKNRLVLKKASHHFRDGDDNILPGKFYLSVFLVYGLAKKIKAKLPKFLHPHLNKVKRTVRGLYKK